LRLNLYQQTMKETVLRTRMQPKTLRCKLRPKLMQIATQLSYYFYQPPVQQYRRRLLVTYRLATVYTLQTTEGRHTTECSLLISLTVG